VSFENLQRCCTGTLLQFTRSAVLRSFLSLAIAHGKLPDEGKAEVSVWNMRDL